MLEVLILNRETFSLPQDGWYQLAALGDFPHAESGVVQRWWGPVSRIRGCVAGGGIATDFCPGLPQGLWGLSLPN